MKAKTKTKITGRNVSLTPQLEEFVDRKLAGGRYQTASEVVRHALRLLEAEDIRRVAGLKELRAEIKVGLDQFDRGEGLVFNDSLVKKIQTKGRARLKAAARRG